MWGRPFLRVLGVGTQRRRDQGKVRHIVQFVVVRRKLWGMLCRICASRKTNSGNIVAGYHVGYMDMCR